MAGPLRGLFRDDIREARVAAGYTTRDIRGRTGLPHGYVAMIEGGQRPPPPPDKILALADALQLDPYRLLLKARIERTAAVLRGWAGFRGSAPAGYRFILKDPQGATVFDVDLASLDGEYAVPGEGERALVLAYLRDKLAGSPDVRRDGRADGQMDGALPPPRLVR